MHYTGRTEKHIQADPSQTMFRPQREISCEKEMKTTSTINAMPLNANRQAIQKLGKYLVVLHLKNRIWIPTTPKEINCQRFPNIFEEIYYLSRWLPLNRTTTTATTTNRPKRKLISVYGITLQFRFCRLACSSKIMAEMEMKIFPKHRRKKSDCLFWTFFFGKTPVFKIKNNY